MSYFYGIVTLALGSGAAASAAWGLLDNGALWIALGMVLGVFTALCVMEWPDTALGDSSPGALGWRSSSWPSASWRRFYCARCRASAGPRAFHSTAAPRASRYCWRRT